MKLIAASIITAFCANGALAGGYIPSALSQEPVAAAPIVASTATDWSGAYIGIQSSRTDSKVSYRNSSGNAKANAFGVHGGYQKDFGRYVLGGELDHNGIINSSSGTKISRLRGRAGMDLGRVMPYVALGVAHTSAKDRDFKLSENGFSYGVGVDFAVTRSFTLGAEYSRQSFNDVKVKGYGVDLDVNLLQVRAAYHF